MSAPIKREDIRKGDRVRMVVTSEFTAACHLTASDLDEGDTETYELIERAVVLPTVDGFYSASKTGDPGFRALRLTHGEWTEMGKGITDESGLQLATRLAQQGALTLLRPVAEVAAEVLAEVQRLLGYDVDPYGYVASKFGATK